MTSEKPHTYLDVRTVEEFTAGHPEGAINVPIAVMQGGVANVDTVMVDGRIVKRGGRLVAYDVDRIVREAKASSLRIRTAAGGRLAPVAP